MNRIKKISKFERDSSVVIIAAKNSNFDNCGLTADEIIYVEAQIEAKIENIALNRTGRWTFVQTVDTQNNVDKEMEKMRCKAFKLHKIIVQQKICSLTIINKIENHVWSYAFAEGITLSNYQFLKYISKKDDKKNHLLELAIMGEIDDIDVEKLNCVIDAVYKTRNLVNEPASVITPTTLAAEFVAMGNDAGFNVQVFDKSAIAAMQMGGILSVNKGSKEPPTYSVLEWKPSFAKNKRPIVLTGKGLTYDTGGHSLKTGDYMNDMKCDMAGGAVVSSVIHAVAKMQIPVYLVGLIPSTDNRLSAEAISPGDIITISDGTTVEVVNTDAEGRIILADALVFAKKYDPELVINVATLTGAAQRAIGNKGIAAMSNASQTVTDLLKNCGKTVHERIAEFPLWEEYAEELKSNVADLKNIGGENAGMITAGKFLEHFTSYPFIHLDIAGVAYAKNTDSYRSKGGTGVGVRLLFEFMNKILLHF